MMTSALREAFFGLEIRSQVFIGEWIPFGLVAADQGLELSLQRVFFQKEAERTRNHEF